VRQFWLIVVLAGGGCNSLLGINELTVVDAPPGTAIDSAVDSPIDGRPDALTDVCFGTMTFAQVCFTPSDAPVVTLPATLDTSDNAMCARILTPSTGPSICVIIGQTITVPTSGTNVTGSRPLMLASSGSITISGELDVGSEGGRSGPGANLLTPACGTPTAGGSSSGEGGGGGAGGSLGTAGAIGAAGREGGGAGGVAAGLISPIVGLRGGCPGSTGGRGENSAANDVGTGGAGGGGVYVVAGSTITIAAAINASGEGGQAANGNKSGGGGGGSGGMIVLEAVGTITIGSGGEVFANGGGGGEGTVTGAGTDGGESNAYNDAGNAGSASQGGGDGGAGAFQATAAGTGNLAPGGSGTKAGGGAGGGGVGAVRIKATLITGNNATRISPVALDVLTQPFEVAAARLSCSAISR